MSDLTRRQRTQIVAMAAPIALGLLSGCATPTTEQPTVTTPHSAATDTASSTYAVAPKSSAAASAECIVTDNSGQKLVLTARYRNLTCGDMTPIAARYFTGEGRHTDSADGTVSTIDDWQCAIPTIGMASPLRAQLTCGRSSDHARFIASVSGLPVPSRIQDPSDFTVPEEHSDVAYFSSPSGFWLCAITMGDAGCSGGMPATAPLVPSPWKPYAPRKPNTVSFTSTTPAEFSAREDAGYAYRSALPLQYGDILSVRGVTCTVDADTGVNCTAGSHGFTVAKQAYNLR